HSAGGTARPVILSRASGRAVRLPKLCPRRKLIARSDWISRAKLPSNAGFPRSGPCRRDFTSVLRTLPTRERGRSGQTSTCFGVLTLPTRPLVTAREMKAFVKGRGGSVSTPKEVEVWPDLPRSRVGKVLKTDVKSRLQVRVRSRQTRD